MQDTHRYNTGALLTPFYHLALRSKSLQPHFCGVTHETANSRHVTVPGDPKQIPFAIPFDVWVSTFLHFIMNDKASKGRPTCSVLPEGTDEDHRSDGFDKPADADVKMLIKISFIEAEDSIGDRCRGGPESDAPPVLLLRKPLPRNTSPETSSW